MSQVLINKHLVNLLKQTANPSSAFKLKGSSSYSFFKSQRINYSQFKFSSSETAKSLRLDLNICKNANERRLASGVFARNNNFLALNSPYLTQYSKFHNTRALFEKDDNKGDDQPPDHPKSPHPPPNIVLSPPITNALAPIQVPDVFPKVPLIAIARNPLFPRFIKMIEVKDKALMELIRRKVHLNTPWIGIFMRKEEKNEDDVVRSLNEVYNVGTFSQIYEVHDLGDRLRMIVMGHRRIKINAAVSDFSITDVQSDTSIEEKAIKNGFRRRVKRANEPPKAETTPAVQPEPVVTTTEAQPPAETAPQGGEHEQKPASGEIKPEQILMVDTSNIVHQNYQMSDEIKALSNEVIQTIRDIITMNPFYRESLSLLLPDGQRVVDNPVYLSDLGAALTNGDAKDQQEVLEEMNIPNRLMLSLKLLKKELEMSKLQQKIGKEVEDKVKQQHRKYMLQEQMKVIKKELGIEKEDKDAIEEKFRERLKNLTVPKQIMDVINEELNKISFLDNHSAEFK